MGLISTRVAFSGSKIAIRIRKICAPSLATQPRKISTSLASFQPDSCVCLNVLEHIQDDRKALSNMASILAPGGVIVLLVPAFAGLYGPIDRNLGHYRRYSRQLLERLSAATGLRIKASYYVNSVGFFGWWANAHIFRREAQSEAQIRAFDDFVVPFLSGLEGGAASLWPVAVCRTAEAMKISVIIPVYNEFRTFSQVLERVQKAALPEGCSKEIIVVDDGSTDGTSRCWANMRGQA